MSSKPSHDDILTEIAVLQNLMDKFRGNKKVLAEIEESYDYALSLLETSPKETNDTIST